MVIWEDQDNRKSNENKEQYYKKRRLANKFLVCYYMTKYPALIELRKKKIEKKEGDGSKLANKQMQEGKMDESPKKFVDNKNAGELEIIEIKEEK